MWELRPKHPKKIKDPDVRQKNKKRERKRKRHGRYTSNVCAKFQSLSLKNGVDIGL